MYIRISFIMQDESMRFISEGCRSLLYLNLPYTNITNGTLQFFVKVKLKINVIVCLFYSYSKLRSMYCRNTLLKRFTDSVC